ncbi:P-loop containing nucleoside triphosphate hydrolase protein [Xylariaceae sp. FL0662B]|nr:P-loop containing nucleoside triphosphate hydrolase protein [Xylariaceae sp. FL0662B]
MELKSKQRKDQRKVADCSDELARKASVRFEMIASLTPPDDVISENEVVLPWYNQLPRIKTPERDLTSLMCASTEFNLEEVLGAIQSGTSADVVRHCLAYYHEYDGERLQRSINSPVKGFPAMFFIVEMNDPELTRHWVKYGGDPNVTYGSDRFPLLAFAILRNRRPRYQATAVLEILLRLGASPEVIPAAYYTLYNRELPVSGPYLDDIQDESKLWCTTNIRPLLASALTVTQRYRLNQAKGVDLISARERFLLSRRKAEVAGLHQLMIGQEMAVRLMKQRLMLHLAMPKKKPLVLLFAGPSGHGKKRLARQFGDLMSLDLLTVDCTGFTREDELFGPKHPHAGCENGSLLNNFLAKKAGDRCIVLMDKFEKATKMAHNALLVPFDEGQYMDRRSCSKVDCSDSIWILATNQLDDIIHEFCKTNGDAVRNGNLGSNQDSLMRRLVCRLRKECLSHFGVPLTGRISQIIPFLTFSPEEAAVVADEGIMEVETRVSQPVVVTPTKKGDRLVGNIQLNIMRDATVCSTIANDYYEPQLGARSIFNGIDEVVVTPLVAQYLKDGDGFDEDQEETSFEVGIDSEQEVEVWRCSLRQKKT